MGQDSQTTLNETLSELDIAYDKYIKAVRITIIRTKLFIEHNPCEIRINNYMKHCLKFWTVNHDIYLSLDPFGMVQYMLSSVM